MQRSLYAAIGFLVGLATAQIIATIHVSSSNAELYRNLILIKDAGYLTVPNQHIMARLHDFGPAFWGGLFFTLTTGAGLSILSLSGAWAWIRLFQRKGLFLIGFLIVWAGILIGLNLRGLCPMASSYFLLIPPPVFWVAQKAFPTQERPVTLGIGIGHVLPILLLGGMWLYGMDSHFFTDFRDHVLFSNRVGTKINDFYYTYTLYPAEVFKPLEQKLLKTAILEGVPQRSISKTLERILLNSDYCSVGGAAPVDLKIEQRGNDLLLERGGRTALKTTLQKFLSKPAPILRDFSLRTDRYAFFRRFTFLSLVIALPLALYLFLHTILRLGALPFLHRSGSSVLASLLCLFVGAALLAYFQYERATHLGNSGLEEALGSPNWHRRLAALRLVEAKRLEISEFRAYPQLLRSPRIPERYWLVRTLGVSRRPGTYDDLLAFLNDPHPNVVSMAFRALEERGDRRAIGVMRQKIESSTHWYSQWYGYRALRGLGWKQSISNSKP